MGTVEVFGSDVGVEVLERGLLVEEAVAGGEKSWMQIVSWIVFEDG